MAASAMADELTADGIKKLQQELGNKKTFCQSCSNLTLACEKADDVHEGVREALFEAGKRAFTILQSRFTNPKYWQAGLEFFLALEFHVPKAAEKALEWREAAMLEVDEETREQAEAMKVKRRIESDRKFNQGQFSDANTPLSQELLLLRQGLVMVDGNERPGMSRDAVHELRLVTVKVEDVCSICQEVMPAGSKAKSMPCGHYYHDDCLVSWVSKNNSCPMCRFDELPSEKQHFDDVERRIQKEDPGKKGIFS